MARVIIIDGDSAFAMQIANVLSLNNHGVHRCATVKEAFAIVSKLDGSLYFVCVRADRKSIKKIDADIKDYGLTGLDRIAVVYGAYWGGKKKAAELFRASCFRRQVEIGDRGAEAVGRDIAGHLQQLGQMYEIVQGVIRTCKRSERLRSSIGCGVAILDGSFRVWYVDDTHNRISGTIACIGSCCWGTYHGAMRQTCPCQACAVHEVFSRKHPADRRMLSSQVNYRHRYFMVAASPIYVEGTEGPLLVVETVIDVTDTPWLQHDILYERIDLVLRGIVSLGFKRTRLYRTDPEATTLVGMMAKGYDEKKDGEFLASFCGFKIVPETFARLKAEKAPPVVHELLEEMQAEYKGEIFHSHADVKKAVEVRMGKNAEEFWRQNGELVLRSCECSRLELEVAEEPYAINTLLVEGQAQAYSGKELGRDPSGVRLKKRIGEAWLEFPLFARNDDEVCLGLLSVDVPSDMRGALGETAWKNQAIREVQAFADECERLLQIEFMALRHATRLVHQLRCIRELDSRAFTNVRLYDVNRDPEHTFKGRMEVGDRGRVSVQVLKAPLGANRPAFKLLMEGQACQVQGTAELGTEMFEPELGKRERRIGQWVGIPLLGESGSAVGLVCIDVAESATIGRKVLNKLAGFAKPLAKLMVKGGAAEDVLSKRPASVLLSWEELTGVPGEQGEGKDALAFLLEFLIKKVGAITGVVALLAEGRLVPCAGEDGPSVSARRQSASFEAIRRRSVVILPDRGVSAQWYSPIVNGPDDADFGSVIAVPLIDGNEVLGCMEVYFRAPGEGADVRVVDWVASVGKRIAKLLRISIDVWAAMGR